MRNMTQNNGIRQGQEMEKLGVGGNQWEKNGYISERVYERACTLRLGSDTRRGENIRILLL